MKAVSIIALLSLLILAASCTERTPPQRSSEDPFIAAPLHASKDITVRFYDSSFVRAQLNAGTASVFEDRRETNLGGGVRVVFYDRKTGRPAATLDADSAVIDDKTKDMTAIGNVVVNSDSSHTRLETKRLVWDEKTERIRTNENVRITTPTEVIEGTGLVSDQFLTDYRIFKVRGVHHP